VRRQETADGLSSRSRATLSLSQAQYDQAKVSGVPHLLVVPLTGSATLVRVIVYHFDSDRSGVFTTNVK